MILWCTRRNVSRYELRPLETQERLWFKQFFISGRFHSSLLLLVMNQPVMVLNSNTKRESGKQAQLGNIAAAKAVSDIIRTTLGPRSMLKMLLDPMGGVVMTNDGNCILREVDVSHPAAKSMIELSRAQDEEVGDGTTSVIILGKHCDRIMNAQRVL